MAGRLCSQSVGESVIIADSLFDKQQYTQSFEIYKEIFEQFNETSPSILLKMAYIEEGIGNYTDALYFLNLHYQKTFNRRTLRKMEEVASKYNLTGYEVTDLDFFLGYLQKYYLYILFSLGGITWILLSYMIHKRQRYQVKPSFSVFLFFVVILIFIFILNINLSGNFGIITAESTYVMAGPSPGSKLIGMTGKGHKVKILGQEDVWLKIRWEDKIAYVREFDIRKITL